MSVLEERLSAVINLVSPEIKDLDGLNADELYDLTMEVAGDFMDKAYRIPENAWNGNKMEVLTDIYDTFRYLDPWCDDLFENMDNLTELFETVLFVAENTEYDNSNWDALLAGVPVNDVLAI